MLALKSRPSVIVTASLPLGGPTTAASLSDLLEPFDSLELFDASEVRDKFDVGGLPSCERVRGV